MIEKLRRPFLLLLVLAPLTALCADRAASQQGAAAIPADLARVFDTRILHQIEIVIGEEKVALVQQRTDVRVPATFTFDGLTLHNVGVRQTGSTVRPFVAITAKPSLSIEFNEFVKGQRLHGVEKLILKNELQDLSLVNEHLTYEVYRRAGLAAPLTAHAVVTINGLPSGIYLMREPIDKHFLRRNFGEGNEEGNLYELDLTPGGHFIRNPHLVDLKRETEENRSRADIMALAEAVRTSTPADFVERVGRLVDLDRYLRYFAVETATSYYDGFSFNTNNTYLYFPPRSQRMVMIPWGADEAFWATRSRITRLRSADQEPSNPNALFARAMRAVPGFREALAAEVKKVGAPPIWNRAVLLERVAQVGRILATAERTGRTAVDIERFERYRPIVEAFIQAGGTTNGTSELPTPP